jgi:endogenous inhibitor of DNA gyrase (YacG/DUF329 family)
MENIKEKRVKVQCAICEKVEFVFPSRAKKYHTCSRECLGIYNSQKYSTKIDKICPICNKQFKVKKSHQLRRVYCSRNCLIKALPEKFKGSGNPNYKNRTEDSNGYMLNNERYVFHRELVKETMGISEIPHNLIVHHKDGNKHTNEPENLILLTHKIHTWIHKNIGNFVFKALSKKQITVEEILSWVEEEKDKEIVKYVLCTNCTQQSVVLKQGELLGSPF